MRWSVVDLLLAVVLLSACATRAVPKPVSSLPQTATASLIVSDRAATVIGSAPLPEHFQSDHNYPPIWLKDGELAVPGVVGQESLVLAVSAAEPRRQRIIARAGADGLPNGALMEFAASPDGATLATLVADRSRVLLMARPAALDAPWQTVTALPASRSLAAARSNWIAPKLIAVTLAGGDWGKTTSEDTLALIAWSAAPAVRFLDRLQCPPVGLSYSADGHFAVKQSDHPQMEWLIDLRTQQCRELAAAQPLRVLEWAPDSASFLYETVGDDGVPGVYRYLPARGAGSTVAVSSGAAAYADDAAIIALGNDNLTPVRAARSPDGIIIAQIAVQHPQQGELIVNSLGLPLTPIILSRSSMRFSAASQRALIDTAAVTNQGTAQKLIEYSYRTHAAAVLATAPPDEELTTSWSPDGAELAVVDSTSDPNSLTILAPHLQ